MGSGKTTVHIAKLAAGITSMAELEARQRRIRARAMEMGLGDVVLVETRNHPRRAEVLDGGSIYWIFAGAMQCRQEIRGLRDAVGEDGRSRCIFVLEPDLVPVGAVPRKPFQGWRYLEADAAPPDLDIQSGEGAEELPEEMRQELARIGVL